jgi:predicted Zn-dependent protease
MGNINRLLRTNLRKIWISLLCLLFVLLQIPQVNATEEFGPVHLPIACSVKVQEKFDQALAMLHSFSFPVAAETFKTVAQEDPNCAMAYWGLAATAIGSLYGGRSGPMPQNGELALQKAKAIRGKTPREQDYIATIEMFYKDADKIDFTSRLSHYADALEKLHRKYPNDYEAEIFYAYALTALGSPKDKTFAYELKGAMILEKLLVKLPNHPGVLHYILHAYDHAPIASRGLSAARHVVKMKPSAPHLRQFPAHIFVRLGLWQESIDTNRAGADVDDLFFKPHAMDFLVYSYLQTGQDAAARRVLDESSTIKIVPHILDAYAMAAMPARLAIERRRWDEAATLTLPHSEFNWKLFPHAEAALVFARALGAARSGNIDSARKDLIRLQELRNNLTKSNSEGIWQDFWVSELEINHDMVAAWIAYTEGKSNEALQMLRLAADLEDSTEKDPVMPSFIISARQLLGELLLEMNNPQQALPAFEAALKEEPSRFWSLYGAARAAELSGDRAKAKAFYTQLILQSGSADDERSELKIAKAFLEKR